MKTLFACLVIFLLSARALSLAGMMIPLYSYPTTNNGDIWKSVRDAATANPTLSFIAIINPNSGPGSSRDDTYVTAIAAMVNAGVKCIGYVSTNYTQVPASTATANMDSYKSWYPQLTGFFLDEMINTGSHESYYSGLTSYAVSIGLPFTVGNAGTATSQAYFDTVNNTVIYETVPLPRPTVLNSGFDSSRCSMMSYNVAASQLNQTYINDIVQYTPYVYITDDVLPNPYDVLPTYFNQLVAYLAAVPSSPSSGPSAPSNPSSPSSPTAPSTSSPTAPSTPSIPTSTPSTGPASSPDAPEPSAATFVSASLFLLLASALLYML